MKVQHRYLMAFFPHFLLCAASSERMPLNRDVKLGAEVQARLVCLSAPSGKVECEGLDGPVLWVRLRREAHCCAGTRTRLRGRAPSRTTRRSGGHRLPPDSCVYTTRTVENGNSVRKTGTYLEIAWVHEMEIGWNEESST